MTQEIPEPTAADEQAKADLDTKVAADEETVAGDLRTEEAAHQQSQADLQRLAEDSAPAQTGGATTPTEAVPGAVDTGTSGAASDQPSASQPTSDAGSETPDPTTATPDASAPASGAPAASSAPDAAGAPSETPTGDPSGAEATSAEPGATLDSPIPGSEPVTEGQSPEGAEDEPASEPASEPQGAYVPPADTSEPQPAATDTGVPAAGAPFDPSSGGGVTDVTGQADASQGSHVGDSGQPLQDDGSWSAETTDDAGVGEPTA